MIRRLLVPVTLLSILHLSACSEAMSAGNDASGLPERDPGKVLIARVGVCVTVPGDLVKGKEDNAFRSRTGDLTVLITYEADAQASVQRLSEGVDLGGSVLVAVGEPEPLGTQRWGLMTVQRDKSDGSILQYRYVIFGDRIPMGTLMAIAVIVEADDALLERAKTKALELLESAEVPSADELNAIREERVAALMNRSRGPQEEQLRQTLMGRVLYRSANSSGGSGTTYAYSTFYERFQLCPSGEGSHVTESRTQVGDDGGSAAAPDAERAAGTWDVTRSDHGLQLELHEASGQISSWDIALTENGEVVLGGKRFRLLGPGDEGGPDCR